MDRAVAVAPACAWPREAAKGTATLSWDDRHRRRIRLATDDGMPFLLDLPEAAVLRDGDGLALETGGFVAVRAAPEDVIEVTCADAGTLMRIAWHIGNRHLPAAIEPQRILLREDHVIVEMLRGLGATVRSVRAPFTPEGGAYRASAGHAHDHDHGGDHDHHHDGHAHHHE